jgi:hypothetical protein
LPDYLKGQATLKDFKNVEVVKDKESKSEKDDKPGKSE